jgi:SAM-dependent methyltransferase
LSGGERILEIGCGTGATLLEIARRYPVRLEGVDVLPEMLAVARRRLRWAGQGGQIALVRARGHELPLADVTYDRVYLESVLGIQTEAAALAMLGEAHRVLRAGGRLVANEAVWRDDVTAEEARTINARCVEHFGVPQASPEPWTAGDWLARMRAVGFEADAGEPETFAARRLRAGGSWRPPVASAALTAWLGLKASLSPVQRAERRRYQRALVELKGMGQAVETRLFVLRKPILTGGLS